MDGLSTNKAKEILKKEGFNEIPEEKNNLFLKLSKKLFSPVSLMLIAASIFSFVIGKNFDGYFILFLLLLNLFVVIWQESKADRAVKKLNEKFSVIVRVLRDGKWIKIKSKFLVRGDVAYLHAGNIVPADGVVLECKNLTLNMSVLTGESLPVNVKKNDNVFSGAVVASGSAQIEIIKTGKNTKFAKTLHSVEKTRKRSLLEEDIIRISKFLAILSLAAIAILSGIFIIKSASILELLRLDLTLLIAGVPISLPTVMSLIIEIGVIELARKNVVVRRLASLENLSNVDFLLTDKTGTLTKNKIAVNEVVALSDYKNRDVLRFAYLTALSDTEDLINKAIVEKAKRFNFKESVGEIIESTPFDFEKKLATTRVNLHGKNVKIFSGAPQTIKKLIKGNFNEEKFNATLDSFAKKSYRVIAIAIKKKNDFDFVGLVGMADSLRDDAKETLSFMRENGIKVVMITGDNYKIAKEITEKLDFGKGKIVTKSELGKLNAHDIGRDVFMNTSAFAEVLPEDKFQLVKIAKRMFVVAVTGDGVNDIPAVKEADVGIAVANAVDALKASADIVLLSNGISVIRNAIIEGRKIFERVYTYSVYRISESQRLIVTVAILGFLYGQYPLTALQVIVLALLNDIPIITLAFDRVSLTKSPSKMKVKKRFILSSLFGLTGIINSLLFFYLLNYILHVDWVLIQTLFFLKLTVSGHMLIFVAHTKEIWYKFLPSWQVIVATITTQFVASLLALTGYLMPGKVSLSWILFVWLWAFFFMQVSEVAKKISK